MKKVLLLFFYLIGNFLFSQSDVNRAVLDTLGAYQSSTCLIIFDGSYTCTGTLLNNTSEDGRPLILTAAHCIDDPSQLESIVVVFGRQELVLGSGISGYEWRSDFGAELLSFSSELDFALFELNQEFPDELMCQYLGWSRELSAVNPVSTIHHPSFDFKEMAHSRENTTISTFNGLINRVEYGHWRVPSWSFGETVTGSSGSSLLDSKLRVIGGLSGSTKRGNQVSDYFFRLDKAWDYYIESGKQLSVHLDPEKSEILSIESTSFKELRSLTKISNYHYTDSILLPFLIDRNIQLTQNFEGLASGEISGIYLTVGEIATDLLNTMTISILSEDQIIHIEEISVFKLDENDENFIPFLVRIPFQGDLKIEVHLNSALNDEFIEFPRAFNGVLTIGLNSLLVHSYLSSSKKVENTQVNSPLIFPNPAYEFVLVDTEIQKAIIYDPRGYSIEPQIEINSYGQTSIDLSGIRPGIYYFKLFSKGGNTFIEKVIVR